jgi:hypothetical protein
MLLWPVINKILERWDQEEDTWEETERSDVVGLDGLGGDENDPLPDHLESEKV